MPKKVPPPEPQTARRFTDDTEIETIIGKGVEVKGRLWGKTNLELRGTIDGSCNLEGLFLIGREGSIRGEITTTNVIVEGTVDGNITATEKVELRSQCRVTGNIQAGSVAIAEGSFFEGEVHMEGQTESTGRVAFREKRSSAPARGPSVPRGSRSR